MPIQYICVLNKSRYLKAQRSILIKLLQWLVFVFSIGFIFWRLKNESLANYFELFTANKLPHLFLALALIPLNYLLEARKWHILCLEFQALSFSTAFKAVLAGSAYSMFTPNRIGDGLGRFHFTPKEQRAAAGYAFGMSSTAQFLSTLVFGLFGLFWLKQNTFPEDLSLLPYYTPLSIITLMIVITVLVLFLSPKVLHLIKAQQQFSFVKKHLSELKSYPQPLKLKLLFLSLARYLVFSAQFIILLEALGDIYFVDAFSRVNLIYLGSTIIPTFAFAELGLRESLSLVFLSPIGLSDAGIFAAAFLLWVMNLMLPAILGHFFILQKQRTT